MVDKVFIVWCKLNKDTDKFDLGIFTERIQANNIAEVEKSLRKEYKIWVSEYTLSKVYKDKH